MVADQLETIILVVMVFLLAGFIKGVIGLDCQRFLSVF